MNYRGILVSLDTSPCCATRTRIALRLAEQQGAHVVGVAPTGQIELPPSAEAAAALAGYSEGAWLVLREQADLAEQRFREDCRLAGFKAFDALVDEAGSAVSLVRHAHCSDLVVMSQADPHARDHAIVRELLEQVILWSARPTLVVPYVGHFDHVGSRVLVAWDDSRGCARALADALPLLRQAARVEIARWQHPADGDPGMARARLDDLVRWLSWHGVAAETRVETTRAKVAEALLSRASDNDVDLIVMGAYGRSRLAERLLGGATRDLLKTMTVPVLMSH